MIVFSLTDVQGERPRGWDWVDIVKVTTTFPFRSDFTIDNLIMNIYNE